MWPQDFGHALQSLAVEAGSLGPPAQRRHPQALQPAVERAGEPGRPRDGEVVDLPGGAPDRAAGLRRAGAEGADHPERDLVC